MLRCRILSSNALRSIHKGPTIKHRIVQDCSFIKNNYYYHSHRNATYHAITRNISSDTQEKQYYVSDHIKDKIKNGDIIYDKIQEKAALRLTKLQKVLHKVLHENEFDVNGNAIGNPETPEDEKLVNGENNESIEPTKEDPSITKEETNNSNGVEEETTPIKPKRIIKGLYIHGPVGCGKTMLMDLFHTLTPTLKIKRIHYYKFMSEIHQSIHSIQKNTTTENISKLTD